MTLDYRFSKQYRLLKTEEFSSVFALRKQRSSTLLHVLRSDNNLLGHARLGLVVGKKVAKRANARNYMKRVIREWFRCHRAQLPPHDIIVRVRGAFNRHTAHQVRAQLQQLLLPK